MELLKLEVILLHPLLFLNYLDGSQLAYAKKPKAKGQHRPDCKQLRSQCNKHPRTALE